MSKSKHLKTKKKKKKGFLTILQIVFLGLMIYSGTHIYFWWKENQDNSKIMNELKSSISIFENENNNSSKIDFEKIRQKNSEVVAFLKVNGTNIEYPVLKHSDNNYYLNHSLDNSKNSAGWIFMDFRNDFYGKDKNVIIYGHNRRDGSMFGTLKNVLNEDWQSNSQNLKISLLTENEEQEYNVFSIYKIEMEEYYITTDFTEKTFEEYIKTVKKRSNRDFGIEVNKDDSILTLSTCDNNNQYRVVLHAKRIK